MSRPLRLKIDVTKLIKSRFFHGKERQDGSKPIWCDIVAFPLREESRFGDTHILKQSKNADEDIDLDIVGNLTLPGFFDGDEYDAPRGITRDHDDNPDEDEEIPF